MTSIKLSIIGAGSAVFSLGLVKDICLTKGLSGSHISFMDIDRERLQVVGVLAKRYANQIGASLTFDTTTDRQSSLEGADFVINTASAVGHQTDLAIREIISNYGYYYGRAPIPYYSYYNLKLMINVARDMERICPEAWLIQAGNPVFDGCTLMTRETNLKIIGLCHGHYGIYKVCRHIGLDPQRVTFEAPGLNHNIWLTIFLYDGKDAYPILEEWIATKAQKFWEDESLTIPPGITEDDPNYVAAAQRKAWDVDLSPAAVNAYRMYGLLPIGDTVRRLGWWEHTDIIAKRRWLNKPWGGQDSHLSWPYYVKALEIKLDEMRRLAKDPEADLLKAIGTSKTMEQHIPIIDALVNDNEGHFQVNVPNNGVLRGLPDDVVVEVPAIINRSGVHPYVTKHLPKNIMLNVIYPDWLRMERNLYAFKTGDRAMILWNILDSHMTRNYDQAMTVLEEIMSLPSFKDMAEHYQWPEKWRKFNLKL